MTRVRVSGLLLLFFLGATTVAWGDAAPVAGVVKHLQVPVPGALVFVYGVSDARLNRARTQPDGSFQVEGVPAGVYDVIAYKTGFYPSLLRLWHQGTPTVSTIAIDLVPSQASPVGRADWDVWSWRDRLPADVLREITSDGPESFRGNAAETIRIARVVNGDFASSASLGGASGSFSRSEANLFGTLPGSLQYSLRGGYAAVGGGPDDSPLARGTARDGVLLIAGSPDSAVSTSYAGREFTALNGDAARLDRESIRFDQHFESGARMEWSISRRAENGFERSTSVIPDLLPAATEGEELKGRWSREGERSREGVTLQVYRRRVSEPIDIADVRTAALYDGGISAAVERDVAGPLSFGARLDARTGSAGSSVAPGGILRLRLGPDASLVVSGARSVVSTDSSARAAAAPRVVAGDEWQTAVSSDASAAFVIGSSRSGMVQVKASTSRIREPLRVYFDGDLLLDVGSLYLFDGNRLEKLTASASGRLAELVDASFSAEEGRVSGRLTADSQSSFALATSTGRYYAGTVSFALRPTRTDLSCALRRVRQTLQGEATRADNFSDMLRVSLGQDLTVLGFDPFGSAWKLVVSYETDSTPTVTDGSLEETALLRHRVMGGLSISF